MPSFPLGTPMLRVRSNVIIKNMLASFTSYWEPIADPATFDDVREIANGFQGQISDLWKPLASVQNSMINTHVVFTHSTVLIDAYSSTGPVVGTLDTLGDADGEPLPNWDALVIQRRTASAGRESRGRMFIPGIDEQIQEASYIVPAFIAAAQDMAAYFGADQTPATTLCHARHWNRKLSIFEVITHCRVLNQVKTRRDRAPNVPAFPV